MALISVAVLAVTGFYWTQVSDINDGVTTVDIGEGPTETGKDGAIDILLVGIDARTDAQGKPLPQDKLAMLNAGVSDGQLNTDTLILIRIPNDGRAATGVSIPRDSYVDIPGFGQHKINSAYARAKIAKANELRSKGETGSKLEVDSNAAGAVELIDTIEQLTGAEIEHYAEVNLLGFYDISNAVGGIDVCLNKAVNDRYSGARFGAGAQTVQGARALAFVRQRHGLPNGDLDRVVRQQVFMAGMAHKVLSSGTLTSPGKIKALKEAVRTNVVLSRGWDVFSFAQQMAGVTGGNLQFKTIPTVRPDLPTPSDGSAVEVDPEAVRSFYSGIITPATTGSSSSSASPSSSSSGGDPGSVSVTVQNASSTHGLAKQMGDQLAQQGFKVPSTGNAPQHQTTSEIDYAPGEKTNAQAVSKAMGGDITIYKSDDSLSPGHVRVVLGGDFHPGPPQQLGPSGLLRLAPQAAPKVGSNGAPCVN
ncbi:LCP family protein [Labedaea rhizosphaerae]|uniref:LytR family transcriptional attenuator n=1 Tax=Labedaea rhizosphaerae TaxID=598644 RepID=A0A4R6SDB7_LABRH|nr:LCP family protein [Labedaea rhizosphaerae]TDP97921.1 LytR family transcriptional attenuator [Labedaea rhizosphaerae]